MVVSGLKCVLRMNGSRMEGCFSDEEVVSGLRGGLRMNGSRMEGFSVMKGLFQG